jgi:hypothetical protein
MSSDEKGTERATRGNYELQEEAALASGLPFQIFIAPPPYWPFPRTQRGPSGVKFPAGRAYVRDHHPLLSTS